MKFIDHRKSRENQPDANAAAQRAARKDHERYVDELIRDAQRRGMFDDLLGKGKPLELEHNPAAGDNEIAYRLLKNNHFAPPEIELGKEIDGQLVRAEARLTRLVHQSKTLRARRVPPLGYEKRAFNAAVERAALEYERVLREANSKILSLNIIAPAQLHRPLVRVEERLRQFRESCPLFDV